MASKNTAKPRIKVVRNRSVFHLQDKKADDAILSNAMIRAAKRSGQLNLSNRGLGSVPEKLYQIDILVLDEVKDVDFSRTDNCDWWNWVPMTILDLSCNAITELAPEIHLLRELTILKLQNNALQGLPNEIAQLKNLKTLNLSRNKIKKLQREFFRLTELRWLDLSYNLLRKIEPDIGDLIMLTFVDLSYNRLKSLPTGFGYMVRLVEVDASHNELEDLPPDIVNLRDLKKLNICFNKIKYLPPMNELRRLEILEANNNNIMELPDFYGSVSIKEIYLSFNRIKEIREEFFEQVPHLQVLSMAENQLELIPESIAMLKKLKRLDFSNNKILKVPTNLGLLTQIQSLKMDGNMLTDMRLDVVRGGTNRMMKYLRDRIVDEKAQKARVTDKTFPDKSVLYTSLPDKYLMKKSNALMVSSKQLSTLPDEVVQDAKEVAVHMADLSKNKFTDMPLNLLKLKDTLTHMTLTINLLTTLPPEISKLSNLQYLDISKNCIVDLPVEMAELHKLKELTMSNNKLKKIPLGVYRLKNLEILLAADNQITEIDVSEDGLVQLNQLAVLDLSNNSIVAVPPELGLFTHIRSVELMGNCFRQPRHAILAKGTEHLMAYLRDRIHTPQITTNDA